MAYDSRQIANDFIRLAADNNRILSIMMLLKLVYIAHGWTLALRDNALITDYAQAWQHGPVVPSVYFAFRPFGVHVPKEFDLMESSEDRKDKSIIEQTYSLYGDMTAFALSKLTHIEGGPWDRTRKKFGYKATIPNPWIKEHYLGKLERASH